MIQLAFLLLEAEAVRRQWTVLGLVGIVWALLGIVIITESVEHIHGFTTHMLGFLLVIEGCVTGSRFRGSDLVSIYAAMGLTFGAGAQVGPALAGLAMATMLHGLSFFVAALCLLFLAFVLAH